MGHQAETLSALCDKALFTLVGLFGLGGLVDYIDRHTWVVGLILGLITIAVKCHFELLTLRLKREELAAQLRATED